MGDQGDQGDWVDRGVQSDLGDQGEWGDLGDEHDWSDWVTEVHMSIKGNPGNPRLQALRGSPILLGGHYR